MWVRINGQPEGINFDRCLRIAIEGTDPVRALKAYPGIDPLISFVVFQGTLQECVQYLRDNALGLINGI